MAGQKLSAQCNTCHENPKLVRRKRKFEQCEDCRRDTVKKRLNARKMKRVLRGQEHRLVQYNSVAGWRVGYFMFAASNWGGYCIQPIGPKGSIPDTITVSADEIKVENGWSKTCPTVEDFYRMNEKPKKAILLVADSSTTARVVAALGQKSVQLSPVSTEREQPPTLNDPKPDDVVVDHFLGAPLPKRVSVDGEDMAVVEARAATRFPDDDPVEAMERNVGIDPPKKPKPPKKMSAAQADERASQDSAAILGKSQETSSALSTALFEQGRTRMKHAPVDLTKARELYETGMSINDVVEAVRGTRAAFDVKKLVRKTLKELGILKD